jgi:hypothetical protein
MSKQNKVRNSTDSAEDTDLARAFDRIVSALQRGDVDELAAALSEEPDPAWLGPGSHEPPKEN